MCSSLATQPIYTMADFLGHETLDGGEVEGASMLVLVKAGQDGNDAPDPLVCFVAGLCFDLSDQPPNGLCGMLDFERRVAFYKSHSDWREVRWRLAHELGHLGLMLWGIPRDLHHERIVSQVGRAIMMPRQPFEQLLHAAGSAYSPRVIRAYPCVPPLQLFQRAVELGF